MKTDLSVLIVDDDEVERMALSRALTSSDTCYEITEVDCVQEALEKLEKNVFNVLLLDYRLPGPNGIEFLFKIKNTPTIHDTAIVMVSNYSDDELIIEAINAGAHDFLLKEDVTPSQLKRSILQSRKRYELERELFQSYQKVKNMAERDSLTGLYNRYHFDESLLQKLKAAKRSQRELIAIMMLDLDKFKHINDTYGHSTGDRLLVEVSQRLKTTLRSNELLSRFGGDEFAIVCENLSTIREAKLVGTRLIQALNQPFDIDETIIHCSVSIGIALFPANGDTADELMKCADIAMYRAKQDIEDRLCVYKDNMQEEVLFRYKVESELRAANIDEDFELNYQPIISEGEAKGVEALLRWPKGVTTQRPDLFIPIAEECGIISRLGEWVVERALSDMSQFIKNGSRQVYLSLNVSPHQLNSVKFSEMLLTKINSHQVWPENIVVEITETALLSEDEASITNIQKLAEAGVRIALDDFGTGYSSLSHLLTFPIDIVKVDKSLVSELTFNGSKNNGMLKGLTLMLDELQIKAVAEGVETLEQAEFCNLLGIRSHQGYLYTRPVDLTMLRTLLNRSF